MPSKEKGTRVTLAKTYRDQNIEGWLVQPKLDGCRATFNGTTLLSRQGKEFIAPELWIERLRSFQEFIGRTLDGELIHKSQLPPDASGWVSSMGNWVYEPAPGAFNTVVSTVRKKVPVPEEWDEIIFYCFDCIDAKPYQERLFRLWEAKYHFDDEIKVYLPERHVPIFHPAPVLSSIHRDTQGIPEILLEHAKRMGWEGLILRNPEMEYEYRRSPNLLKYKPHEDIEATVIEVVSGKGKFEGKMGALVCLSDGQEFRVGTGFTDAERDLSDWVGQIITVEFFERTPSGAPRHPRFKTRRNYE